MVGWTFDGTKTKHDECRGKGCMKKFCKSLEEHEKFFKNDTDS